MIEIKKKEDEMRVLMPYIFSDFFLSLGRLLVPPTRNKRGYKTKKIKTIDRASPCIFTSSLPIVFTSIVSFLTCHKYVRTSIVSFHDRQSSDSLHERRDSKRVVLAPFSQRG